MSLDSISLLYLYPPPQTSPVAPAECQGRAESKQEDKQDLTPRCPFQHNNHISGHTISFNY